MIYMFCMQLVGHKLVLLTAKTYAVSWFVLNANDMNDIIITVAGEFTSYAISMSSSSLFLCWIWYWHSKSPTNDDGTPCWWQLLSDYCLSLQPIVLIPNRQTTFISWKAKLTNLYASAGAFFGMYIGDLPVSLQAKEDIAENIAVLIRRC